jgi:hypothetical protein
MTTPELSWQGIGISSDPSQRNDPLSVHLLAYLTEAAESSDTHIVVIADTPQASNYMALKGLPEQKATRIARKKGKRKKKDLERICKANGLSNIEVMCWDDAIAGHEEVFREVHALYDSNSNVREAILSTVPARLRDRTEDVDTLAKYAVDEISAILSFSGVKFGHEREKVYDELATQIHEEFGIGNKPEFAYSDVGLEYVPQTGSRIEPYSALEAPGRVLLTDSRREFLQKVADLPERSYRKLVGHLEKTFGESLEDVGLFYDAFVSSTFSALTRPMRIARAAVMASLVAISLGGGGAYVHHDAEQIRNDRIAEIHSFVIAGPLEDSLPFIHEKTAEANKEIERKYGITNYFDM